MYIFSEHKKLKKKLCRNAIPVGLDSPGAMNGNVVVRSILLQPCFRKANENTLHIFRLKWTS